MKKIFTALVLLLLCLAAPVWAADAEPVSIGVQAEIAQLVHSHGSQLTGVVRYDPVKLEIGQQVYLYEYINEGFVKTAAFYPLIFDGQLAFLVQDSEGKLWWNQSICRWLREADVPLDKPLALVDNGKDCYIYDGNWQLLGELHYCSDQQADGSIGDMAEVDGSGLELVDMNQRLTPIADAYLGRLSMEQQAEVAKYQAEQEALRKAARQKQAEADAEAEAKALAQWLEQIRAQGYVPVYLNGELLEIVCCLQDGRAMVEVWDIMEVVGGPMGFDTSDTNWLMIGGDELKCRLNQLNGQVELNGKPAGQVALAKIGGKSWVEVRGMAELFGLQVRWDPVEQQIIIK